MLRVISFLLILVAGNMLVAPVNIAKASESNKVNPYVYNRYIKEDLNSTYKRIFTALENNGYFVIFEPNIGKNLSFSAKRWGDDYNKNNLKGIRGMVFCNSWYANQVSNLDPELLVLCPLHITLYQKDDETHILFVRPGKLAEQSPAKKLIKELEDDVIRTIEVAITR